MGAMFESHRECTYQIKQPEFVKASAVDNPLIRSTTVPHAIVEGELLSSGLAQTSRRTVLSLFPVFPSIASRGKKNARCAVGEGQGVRAKALLMLP